MPTSASSDAGLQGEGAEEEARRSLESALLALAQYAAATRHGAHQRRRSARGADGVGAGAEPRRIPSLSSTPLFSPSSLSPAQHALFLTIPPLLTPALNTRLQLLLSRFRLSIQALTPTPSKALAPTIAALLATPPIEVRPYDAWGVVEEMVRWEQAGGRGGEATRRTHGEVGLPGVIDRGGRMEGGKRTSGPCAGTEG